MQDATPGMPSRGFHALEGAERRVAPCAPRELFEAGTIRSFFTPGPATRVLEAAVDQSNAESHRMHHVLLSGPAECGKHVLARAVVRDLAQPALEVDAECVSSLDHLMEIARTLRHRDVLLLRRVDRMPRRAQRHLAMLLSEHRAPFGARPLRQRFAERDPDAPRESVAEFTLVATAREPHAMVAALLRRVELHVELPHVGLDAMRHAVKRAAAAHGLAMEERALGAIAAACMGQRGDQRSVIARARLAQSVVLGMVLRARSEGVKLVTADWASAVNLLDTGTPSGTLPAVA